MAIDGVVTSHDVLLHPLLIARLFGVPVLLRCVVAIARHEHTTFLALAWSH